MTFVNHCTTEDLIALQDGQLSRAEATDRWAHVHECPSCRQNLAEVRSALSLASRQTAPAFGPVEAPAFVHRVRRGVRQRYGPRVAWWWRQAATLCAGATAGAICAALILGGPQASGPAAEAALAVDQAGGAAPGAGLSEVPHPEAEAVGPAYWQQPDEGGDQLWVSALDDYLEETASDAELLARMGALLEDEAALAALMTE